MYQAPLYIVFVEIVREVDKKDSDDDPFVDLDGAEVKGVRSFREPEDQ